MTIADRSAAVRTPLVPAGYAFIIWAPLFLGLSMLAFWLTRPPGRTLGPGVALPLIAILALNGLWEVYVPLRGLDSGSAGILFVSLLLSLGLSLRVAPCSARNWQERWLLALPILALAGWLTAAFFANLSSMLLASGVAWIDPNRLPVALTLLALLFALGFAMALRLASYAYVLPLVWALAAVTVSNVTWFERYTIAVAAALAGLILLAIPPIARLRRAQR
ncbi:MAG: hypothetical protein GDA47_03160, partial [Rhodospirillales bacterium]|nr:hypothetical protein [Rhodospirillales bacterium]